MKTLNDRLVFITDSEQKRKALRKIFARLEGEPRLMFEVLAIGNGREIHWPFCSICNYPLEDWSQANVIWFPRDDCSEHKGAGDLNGTLSMFVHKRPCGEWFDFTLRSIGIFLRCQPAKVLLKHDPCALIAAEKDLKALLYRRNGTGHGYHKHR